MNFEVLSVSSADPGYGQYNVGPTSGAQYYDGKAFVDSHDDGTTYCGQAQSMPAVVSLKLSSNDVKTVKIPDVQITNSGQKTQIPIELGTVIMQENTPFVVTSFVETKTPSYGSKDIFIPVAVTGATMVESKYVIGGHTAIKAGQLLDVYHDNDRRPLGIAMMDEEQVDRSTSRLIMVYVSA